MSQLQLVITLLVISLVAISCEKEDLGGIVPQTVTSNDCLYQDCISDINPYVLAPINTKVEYYLDRIQLAKKMEVFWNTYARSGATTTTGLPAWSLIDREEVQGCDIKQIFVPIIKRTSKEVEALVIITVKENKYDFSLIERKDILKFPKRAQPDYNSKGLSVTYDAQVVIDMFSDRDITLFGSSSLTADNQAVSLKDCKPKFYQALNCSPVWGGEGADRKVIGLTCSSVTRQGTGCGGGTGTGGPSSGPTGGQTGGSSGGPSGGSGGPRTHVTDRDRCVEDGIDCEEEEGEDDDGSGDIIINTDSIIVDDKLKQFGCASSVLSDYFRINGDLNELINSVFDEDPFLDLKFTIGYTGTNYAKTEVETGGNPGTEIYKFDATIMLSNNPMHSDCSKDLLYSTILHETIHAYYDYLRRRDGYISINQYPLFLDKENSRFMHHSAMAADYVDRFTRMLRNYNPRISDETATHLAWVGLSGTPAYDALPEELTGAIEQTELAASCRNSESEIAKYNFKRCE